MINLLIDLNSSIFEYKLLLDSNGEGKRTKTAIKVAEFLEKDGILDMKV